jgi:hypothetical protein
MPPRAQHLGLARDESIVSRATVISKSLVLQPILVDLSSRLRLCLERTRCG